MSQPEAPHVLTGPPWGGPDETGYCCDRRVYERRMLDENRGQYHSVHRLFVVGKWQCHVNKDHHGKLPSVPLVVERAEWGFKT